MHVPNKYPQKMEMIQEEEMKKKSRAKSLNQLEEVEGSDDEEVFEAQPNLNQTGLKVNKADDENKKKANLERKEVYKRGLPKELPKLVEVSDVIISLVDSRLPQKTEVKELQELVAEANKDGKKRTIVRVMGKIDSGTLGMLNKNKIEAEKAFKTPVFIFKGATTKLASRDIKIAALKTHESIGGLQILTHLQELAKNSPKKSLSVSVVGYSGTGKTSLVEALKKYILLGKEDNKSVAVLKKNFHVHQLEGGVNLIEADLNITPPGTELERLQQYLINGSEIPSSLQTACLTHIITSIDRLSLMRAYKIPSFIDPNQLIYNVGVSCSMYKEGQIDTLKVFSLIVNDYVSGRLTHIGLSGQEKGRDREQGKGIEETVSRLRREEEEKATQTQML